MNIKAEVDMQAVRERLDREQEQLQEERQALRHDYRNQGLLFDSFAVSTRVNPLALVPILAWLAYAVCVSSPYSAADIVVFGGLSMCFIYYAAPYLSSVAACLWFRDSNMSPRFVAATFTLLVDAAYLGWAIFLTC